MTEFKKDRPAATGDVTFLIRGIPEILRVQFKAACAQKQCSMTSALIQLMQATVDAHSFPQQGASDVKAT